MLDRQISIISAAAQVFQRYGFKRATMNDIAAEAGVARQTLYNAFANKEALLRGLIEMHIEETCQSFAEHMEANGSLEDGLELAFDHFARKPYQLLRNTPHGGEIMEELENSASDEMAESKLRFTEALTNMFAPHFGKDSPSGFDAETMADFVVHTAMGYKAKASSAEHLDRLLATAKKLVVAAA